MPNVDLHPPKPLPVFRKIAIGTWRTAYDPQVYGTLVLRMEPVLKMIDEFRERTGKRLTVTHVVAKAAALALRRMPDANAMLRFGRIYRRKTVRVFMQVAMVDETTGKPDLSGVSLKEVDDMPLEELVDATEKSVSAVRQRKDPALEKSRVAFARMPGLLMHGVLRLVSFLIYTLNLDLSSLGIARDSFGSIMVTNIGSLGLHSAFAPLVPFSRVPMVVTVGKVVDEPVVENGEVVPGKVMRLGATFDHRFIDGSHASALARTMNEIFTDPNILLKPTVDDPPEG